MPPPPPTQAPSPLPPPPAAQPVAPAAGGRPGPLRSADLLGAHQTVEIEHNGHVYRLQSTKAGKLILTK